MISFKKLLMTSRLLLVVAVMATLCGCAHPTGPHFKAGSGDAGQFIVRQAVLRGAEPKTSKGLPAVSGSWNYAADNSGVIIRMPTAAYPAVETMLIQAFGTPEFGPADTADGRKVGAYRLTRNGAALQFGRDSQWTMVIVLREPTEQDVAADFLRRLQ